MKTILVDAINTLLIKGEWIFNEMYELLQQYPNRKIILTNATSEEIKNSGLDKMPYPLFSLEHNPNKTDLSYYQILVDRLQLNPDELIYFEHNEQAVNNARIKGITTLHYNKDTKDLVELKRFLDDNL